MLLSKYCVAAVTVIALPLCLWNGRAQSPTESVTVDAQAPAKPFPHFWEQMFGSGGPF